MGPEVALLGAFLAGVLSFVSPYVLPLVPSYLSFLSGLSLDEIRGTGPSSGASGVAVVRPFDARRRVLASSAAFCIGFTIVFVSLGASANVIGQWLIDSVTLFRAIAGTIVILFGLHALGVLRIAWLSTRRRVQTTRRPAGLLGGALTGIAFAVGWTPCLGPILAGVLAVAATQESVRSGVGLLAVYSLGLAVPFLVTALAMNQVLAASSRIRHHYHTIEIVSGALLVVVGMLILTNRLRLV